MVGATVACALKKQANKNLKKQKEIKDFCVSENFVTHKAHNKRLAVNY